MKKILVLLFSFLAGHIIAQSNYSKEVLEQIQQVENNLSGRVKINGKGYNLLQRMAYFKVKGLSIAVVDNYQIIWAKAYGWADEKEKRALSTETLFEPGSISKSLNAVAVLKLVQDGKLDLHTDINQYLKSWKFPYDSLSRGRKITLAHLLSHSAGLSVHGFPGYDRKSKLPTLIQILDGKSPANTPAVRSQFEPGLKFQYSGGGTTISQLLINDLSGEDYDKFLYKNVLEPMGMKNSFYTQPPDEKNIALLASGYRADGTMVENNFHVYPEQAAAGLWMTPSDLCNYIIETQLAYEGKSAKVLNQEMTLLRLTPYVDKSAALGVFIDERGSSKYFQHGAGNEGFRGQYYGSLQGGKGVAVFVNSDNGAILFELINSVAETYHWKDFYQSITKNEITLPNAEIEKFSGTYEFEGLLATIIKTDDGYFYLSDGIYSKMHFTSKKEFFNEEFLSEKTFLFDNKGNVSGFLRKANGKDLATASKINYEDTLHAKPEQISTMGWYLLENKQFENASHLLKRAMQVDEEDLAAVGNLGHCYLFTNQYELALKQYKEFINKTKKSEKSMQDMLSQDFVLFKNKGFDKKLMDKAIKDLGLKMPDSF